MQNKCSRVSENAVHYDSINILIAQSRRNENKKTNTHRARTHKNAKRHSISKHKYPNKRNTHKPEISYLHDTLEQSNKAEII